MLRTSAGRTFAAIPRSTNQTSPRAAKSFRLATIEIGEEAIGSGYGIFVLWQIVRSQGHPTREFGQDFRPILIRQRLEFLEQLLGGVRHEIRVARCVLCVKLAGDSQALM